jgi:hypothetical protein
MTPFQVQDQLLTLCCQYPDPAALRQLIVSLSLHSRESIVRLWLTEGIPFAFRDRPAIYEAIRAWLGARLTVCPKDITLLGSARIGYSLAPPPDYGRIFNSESDLDLSVVSQALFEELAKSFNQWAGDYSDRSIAPHGSWEQYCWDENLRGGPNQLTRGFLDANKIPTWHRYPIAQTVSQTMWLLKQKLEITGGAPKIKRASIRVYNSWRALVAQVSFSLRTALSERPAH